MRLQGEGFSGHTYSQGHCQCRSRMSLCVVYLFLLSISVPSCSVLFCSVMFCSVLCCAVLCCAVLCCAVLCCAVLCCAVLCCAVLLRVHVHAHHRPAVRVRETGDHGPYNSVSHCESTVVSVVIATTNLSPPLARMPGVRVACLLRHSTAVLCCAAYAVGQATVPHSQRCR